jgi:hypothetical protein
MRISRSRAGLSIATLGLIAGLVTACGSSSVTGTPAAQPSPNPSAGRLAGISSADRSKIQQCLTAAGIAVPTPPAGSGFNGTPRPGGTPPPNRPSGAGNGGGLFQSAQVQQALKACGITLPSPSTNSG